MITLEISPEYLADLLENHSERIRVEFPKEEWAPGVWAGCEGLSLAVFGERRFIGAIDLDKRHIYLTEKK